MSRLTSIGPITLIRQGGLLHFIYCYPTTIQKTIFILSQASLLYASFAASAPQLP